MSEAEAQDRRARTKPLAVSLLALPLMFALSWLLLPGVVPDGAALTGDVPLTATLTPPYPLGVFSLGLSPIVGAGLLAGIAILFVPQWRRELRDDPAGQRKVLAATQVLTAIVAVTMAWAAASMLATLPDVFVGPMPLAVLTLAAGTMLLLVVSERFGRHGLANGLSVMIAGGAAWVEIERIAMRTMQPDPLARGDLALLVATPVVAVYVLMRILDPRRAADGWSTYRGPVGNGQDSVAPTPPRLRLPASGLVPLAVNAVLFAPAVADLWYPLGLPTAVQVAFAGTIAGVVALALAFVLHPADRLARLWSRPEPGEVLDTSVLALARSEVRRAAVHSAVLLGALAAFDRFAQTRVPPASFPSASNLLLLSAVILDLRAEWHARGSSKLVTVAVKHDVDAADATLAALGEAGIPAHARGASHRTLLQIFGAYLPIELMVAPATAERARAIAAPADAAPYAEDGSSEPAGMALLGR